ncbi:putative mediator of RNA polymerase II transcription subunit 12 isoform X2 [Bombyx mandarina]|uniref:Mediator of RNA polymerase II transcription subunit 12 isoform X2 n=1 Tax=Bombyx mandarina TaxID=7092 RepID=A0A6J2KAH1_BOMMA|nr:putative mediator of RNA polymerase II transcription subunit 12 isoform X2 [Bombyx mandarina]
MKVLIILAIALCAVNAADMEDKDKEKRQTNDERVPTHFIYRNPRKQEQVAPVEEPQQDEDKAPIRADEYRPGQVFSLNAQELLDLQPERKAPLSSNQLLQQLYSNPQQDDKQNLQQFYYLEPQARQVPQLQPSHAVIARPSYSSNGGEASVGAALAVSDNGANSANTFNHELLALLGQAPIRPEESHQQTYSQQVQSQQSSTVESIAPQYQQVDRYILKSNKKSTKPRSKVAIAPPQASAAPQQYLIETTNIQQQQQQHKHLQQQQQQQPQPLPQYRPALPQQRIAQVLRYVSTPQPPTQLVHQGQPQSFQQTLYERPESQGLKVVAPPKLQSLQQSRPQYNYRIIPQYQQEATPKQYRIVEAPRTQQLRPEQRLQSLSIERPVSYLKRYPEPEKFRSVKIYDPVGEGLPQPTQVYSEQYLLRPVYTQNEQRPRYEQPSQISPKSEQARVAEQSKPLSTIFVSKNLAPRKLARPQPMHSEQNVQIESEQPLRLEQFASNERINIEQHGRGLDERRSQLPPPKNNKAYTPEEFAALVAAGYAVTPIPVSSFNLDVAQSRSLVEAITPQPTIAMQQKRRPASRRHQYLPLRGDDAP